MKILRARVADMYMQEAQKRLMLHVNQLLDLVTALSEFAHTIIHKTA